MNLAKISVNRPTLIVVIFTILLYLGFSSYKSLKYELMPEMTAPAFMVMTVYPGASSSQIENNVTKKVEEIISSVQNIEHIQSTSSEGISTIGVSLKLSADIDEVIQDAQRRINEQRGNLPKDIEEPMVSKIAMNDMPIMNIGATSSMPSTEFYNLLKYNIKPQIERIKGIAEVSLIGGSEREIRVSLDPVKLSAYKISSAQVIQTIQSTNIDFPTGKIKDDSTQVAIRLAAKYKNIEDLKNIVVAVTEDGSKVKLKEIAEVIDTEKDPEMLARIDGKNSVGLTVKKQTDANTVEIAHLVLKKLESLEKSYKSNNIKFSVPFNSSIFTEKAADSVMHDLFLAVILVALVMLVFLHGLRNAFIVIISIPLSLVTSFTGMYLLGYTLNIMTLLALSLVIGILVDDAIVVLENIYRHMEIGKNRKQATLDGRSEISFTAIAITLVDVVVFLPIGLSSGFVSAMVGPFALVVVITTLLSLFIAFTAVPLLTSRLAKYQPLKEEFLTGRFFIWFERQIDKFGSLIHGILIWSFRHKIVTFLIVVLLFIGSVALIPAGFVGSEMFALGDASEFVLQIELPKDVSLKETNLKVLEIEKLLSSKPEIKSIFSTVGAASSGMMANQSNACEAEINVKLVDKQYRTVSSKVFANQIKNYLNAKITGTKITAAVMNPFFGSTDDSPIQVIVKSSSQDSLYKYAENIKKLIEQSQGTIDVKSSLENISNEIAVNIDREKMADLGLSLPEVGSVMSIAFSGNTDTKYSNGAYEYDINVVYDEFDRRNIKDVSNLTFINSANQQIRLSQFANIEYVNGSTSLERFDRSSSITIQSQVLGRPSGDVGDDVRKQIDGLSLPSEVSIYYAGDMEMQDEAFGTLGFALITAIFLVYLVMVALYESYLYPLVVIFSIPLAIIGAIFALALTQDNLSFFSMLGMIMLIGLVAKNAILVVDFTTRLIKQGYSTTRALLMATRTRLRPVLMTTISMIIGLLPIALASGAASEWKNCIARVMIGGLTSSMLLTLVVVPVVFLIFDSAKRKVGLWIGEFRMKLVKSAA